MGSIFTINYIILEQDNFIEKINLLYKSLPNNFLQINFFDTICTEKTRKISLHIIDKVGNLSTYNECSNISIASILNKSLNKSTGKFINFSNSYIEITSKLLLTLYEIIKKNKKSNIFCVVPFKISNSKKILYFKKNSGIYTEKANFLNLCLESYFWEYNNIKDIKFNEYILEYNIDFIIRNIANQKKYYLTDLELKVDLVFETDFYNFENQYLKEWYTKTINDTYIPLVKKYKGSYFVQLALTYLVEIRFACNRNNRNKNIINYDEIQDFIKACAELFNYIDDKILIKYNINDKKLLPKYMNFILLKIKYKNKNLLPKIYSSAGQFFAGINNIIIDKSENIKLEIKSINRFGKKISFDYELTNIYVFNKKDILGFVKIGTKRIQFIQNNVYSLDKYFNITMKSGATGIITIPYEELSENKNLSFYLKYDNCIIKLPLLFVKSASRLGNGKNFYYRLGKYIISYDDINYQINIKKANLFLHLKKEMNLYRFIIKKAIYHEINYLRMFKIIGIRLIYWITKPFIQDEIWLTFDQLFKGGDNGEYLFRYINDHPIENIKMYYIINKNCDDYIRLKNGYKNILCFNSFKLKIFALHASYVFATRVDVKQYCGFNNSIEEYFRDILKFRVLCLQHGLSIQQIAEYQNRIFDNTRYYFCVSEYEIKNILHPVYGYNKNQLILTGAPRYDGLINNDKHQILIAPTWRRNVTAGTNRKGQMHSYSINFKNTVYYNIYNSLINDKKLINCAKQYGYRLIYLIHPILSPQINDFKRNDYVEIIAGSSGKINYEKIISESSLMVTDHSGIQYDFAFMKKPIIYYHPDALPPQYEAKTMNYETMGFGPICKNHNQLVETICLYIKNNCTIIPEYEHRIKSFFAFTDRNNCRRVVESMAYIRALETARNMQIARYMAWRMIGYEVHTDISKIDTMLSKVSCRIASATPPLRIKKFSPEGVQLIWSVASKAKQYMLSRIINGNEEFLAGISPKQTTFTDSTEHVWPIDYKLSVDLGNKVAAVAVIRVEEPLKVLKPKNLKLEYIKNNVLRLIWESDAHVSGWNIRYKTNNSNNKYIINKILNTKNFFDIKLEPNEYYFSVESFSINISGIYYSGYCNEIYVNKNKFYKNM